MNANAIEFSMKGALFTKFTLEDKNSICPEYKVMTSRIVTDPKGTRDNMTAIKRRRMERSHLGPYAEVSTIDWVTDEIKYFDSNNMTWTHHLKRSDQGGAVILEFAGGDNDLTSGRWEYDTSSGSGKQLTEFKVDEGHTIATLDRNNRVLTIESAHLPVIDRIVLTLVYIQRKFDLGDQIDGSGMGYV